MSTVKKCDRCGAYYPHPGLHEKRVFITDDTWKMVGKWIDLCDDCMRKLLKWLDDEVEK